ncbi:MAG: PIN domain-containing protein [Cyanobacteria bacterium J06634_6]
MEFDKVFVDTAAWIALLNNRDTYHVAALKVMTSLRQQNAFLVTTEFVLLEVADAFSQPSLRAQTINFIEGLPQFSALKVVPISRSLWLSGWTLYKQREDKDWGLTDCISFVTMAQEDVTQAFTSDRHFEQAGFVNLL